MGGKSRKTGGVSLKLIQALKANIGSDKKTKNKCSGKKKINYSKGLFDDNPKEV